MSAREAIFLGTASQVPTRARNHNALFLRWDALGILIDPGEGTQRQMAHAGLAASQITHVLITHFHGDHCLGLAALVQRISLDRVPHAVQVIYPRSGQQYFERLRYSSIYHDQARLEPRPFAPAAQVIVSEGEAVTITARPLDHRVDCFGYRVQEPDGRRVLPERLAALGLRGAQIGELTRRGVLEHEGRRVTVEEVSEPRPGQAFAVVMDTRPCAAALELARGVDLLVSESTYLSTEAQEAHEHYHMTATQAAQLARDAGARRLALTHFSQRYTAMEPFQREAEALHPDVVIADDLCVVAVPKRRP